MEPRSIKQEASDLLARGKFAQAEVLFRQMLLTQPRDGQLWVRHAEALKRLGRTDDSVESYRRAAAMLAEAHHFPRAVAALKLALEQRPDDLDLISELIRVELRKNAREGRSSPVAAVVAPPRIPTPDPMLALPVLEEPITNPGITIEVVPPDHDWPQMRRLSARAVALKTSADARWIVLESDTEVRVSFADEVSDGEDSAS